MSADTTRGASGWTGGQYSLTRILFGSYLAAHFLAQATGDGPLALSRATPPPGVLRFFPNLFQLALPEPAVAATLGIASVASLAFAGGVARRPVALALGYLATCSYLSDPLGTPRCLPFLIFLHAAVPVRPFGALDARGRTNPAGTWHMPPNLLRVAWFLLAATYAVWAIERLLDPADAWRRGEAIELWLESPVGRPPFAGALLLLPSPVLSALTFLALGAHLAFAPLAAFARTRRLAWTTLLGLQLAAVLATRTADSTFALLFVHLFTFLPAWVPALGGEQPETLFYDGDCGFCHRSVRFVLAEDRAAAFRFAPLQSELFHRSVPEAERSALPDSIVLERDDDTRLVRSDAALHLSRRLGGLWRVLAAAATVVPRGWRDGAYDSIAAVRHRLFPRPEGACPLVPPEWADRFRA